MQEVTAYKCDHCAMVSMYKGHVLRHEKVNCRKSPDRQACVLCLHFENDFEDGPFCVDDRHDIVVGTQNDTNGCEFFESKFARKKC